VTLTVKDIARLLVYRRKTVYAGSARASCRPIRCTNSIASIELRSSSGRPRRKIPVSPEILRRPETSGVSMPSLVEALGERRRQIIESAALTSWPC